MASDKDTEESNVWEFSFDDEEAAALFVISQKSFFTRILELGADEMDRIEEEFKKASAGNDKKHMAHLANEGAETLGFIEESAELAMVAMYHWVERTMKRELVRLHRAQKMDSKKVGRMRYPELETSFKALGVQIDALTNATLVTQTLRKFANSWKHNAESASDELKKDLGITAELRGHFSEEEILKTLSQKLGTKEDASAPDIVRAFVSATEKFLLALISASRKQSAS